MAPRRGFEPRRTVPKTGVLPLHQRGIVGRAEGLNDERIENARLDHHRSRTRWHVRGRVRAALTRPVWNAGSRTRCIALPSDGHSRTGRTGGGTLRPAANGANVFDGPCPIPDLFFNPVEDCGTGVPGGVRRLMRDSNPRGDERSPTALAGRRLKPLGQSTRVGREFS